MSIRDQRQAEFADKWLNSNRRSILNLCPRFGKIRTTINILNKLNTESILIAYPDNKIKDNWRNEFIEMGFNDYNVTYTTFLSLKKYTGITYDIVIFDEIHLLSGAQIKTAKWLMEFSTCLLGLTGTLSSESQQILLNELKLPVLATYPIKQAIDEGVITDYEITVVKVPLDVRLKQYNGKSEKVKFESLTRGIHKLENEEKNTMFLRLARMRIIQNSVAKLNKTKELLKEYVDERILVFCGVTKIADSLGIPSHHSRSPGKELFNAFVTGEFGVNHLAVCKIGNTGVTYKPLNRVIINYFDSNGENLAQKILRCMSFEFDNPDKKAHIIIISSTEPAEAKWLFKALEFFDKTKINYV
jgi:hypothetical protein